MRRLALAGMCLLVVACHRQTERAANASVDIDSAAEAARNDIAKYAAGNLAADNGSGATGNTAANAGAAATPAAEASPADSAQDAVRVVQAYYALIAAGQYRDAWALWDHGGQDSGQSPEAFAASFAKYADYHAEVGAPGDVDAGAGQRYVTVPVRVAGRLKAGGAFTLAGTVTLHRTGDIDGATAAQKSWHLHNVDLKPVPAQGDEPALPVVATAQYRCIDGSRFVVRFDNRADTAAFTFGGKHLVLDGQRPASGIWYKGAGYELRGKGKEATLTSPSGPPLPCTAG